MSVKKNLIGCSGLLLVVGGLGFVFQSVMILLNFIFNGTSFLSNFLDPDNDGGNIYFYRTMFGILVFAAIVFFASGGRVKDLFKN